jgi:hypothetical protein
MSDEQDLENEEIRKLKSEVELWKARAYVLLDVFQKASFLVGRFKMTDANGFVLVTEACYDALKQSVEKEVKAVLNEKEGIR